MEENLGSSISGLGDINGDGRSDLLIGAITKIVNGESLGGAYVLYGRGPENPFPAMVSLTLKYVQMVNPIMPAARAPAMMKIEHPAKGKNFPVPFSESEFASAMAGA